MREHDEIVKDIKSILEEKVAPSVAAHNGVINFIDWLRPKKNGWL